MMEEIVVIREGEGSEVLLVHGGASPATTWSGLESLRGHWALATVHRRGFPPSPPPPDGRQDFDVDAADLGLV
jgi:pimeloyl-ACP methyl ester carboxylesterase